MKKKLIAIILTSTLMIALIVVLWTSILMITPDITRVTAAIDDPTGNIIPGYRDDLSTQPENNEASMPGTVSDSDGGIYDDHLPLSDMPRTGDNGTLTGLLILLGISLMGVATGLWHIWKGHEMRKESI